MARLIFGPWEPDKPGFLTETVQTANNVYAATNGYRPIKQFVPLPGGMLPGVCVGAGSFVSPIGTTTILAGTQAKLYRARATEWEEIGVGYSLQSGARWRFAQFGSLAIATNGIDRMLKIDTQTGEVALLGAGAPSEAGTPPRARILAGVKDFLVAAVIDDDVRTLAWCGINNAEWWTYGQNQSDYQIMPSGGEITGLFGGEVGIVLQRSRISRMTYVGDNVVFQFDEISSNVGCISPHSTAQWGSLGFFRSDSGFMMWDGAGLKSIGQERVDRYFASRYSRPDYDRMSTAIDPANNLVAWSMGDAIFFYNWVLDRWTICDYPASVIFPGFSRDISLDELDALYGSLDAVPASLDSPIFLGGDPRFYVFNQANTVGTFSGANQAGTIRSTTFEPTPGRSGRVRWVRPISDAETGIKIGITARERLGQADTEVVYSELTASGDIAARESGRYLTLALLHDAGAAWSFAQGVEFTVERGAKR